MKYFFNQKEPKSSEICSINEIYTCQLEKQFSRSSVFIFKKFFMFDQKMYCNVSFRKKHIEEFLSVVSWLWYQTAPDG